MTAKILPFVFDRQSAIVWARAVLSDHDAVFLDTETTGLDNDAEVVEIAVVDRTGKVLIDSIVRPSRAIPFAATSIHGISNFQVARAPRWADFFPKISSICCDRLVIVYNADYDLRLIQQSCRIAGIKSVSPRFYCAMQAYSCFRAGHATRERPQFQRLESAARRFSLDIPNHRALGDALACLGVVQGMADAS